MGRWTRWVVLALLAAVASVAWLATGSLADEPLPSATTLSSNVTPSRYGQSVTFSATVVATPPDTATPTGLVTFKAGSTVLGSSSIAAGNKARLTVASLPVGTHGVTAEYAGDATFSPSGAAMVQEVAPADTTVALTGVVSPAVYGSPVTYIATVGVVAPGKGTRTGSVTFFDGDTPIATAPLVSNKAKLVNPVLAPGPHDIRAVYSGDVGFAPSTSATKVVTVTTAPTVTTLTSAPNPSVVGKAVTFTVTVSPPAGGLVKPSGAVTIADGPTALVTLPLDAAGKATWTTSSLAFGGHSLTAAYAGDGNFSSSVDDLFHNVRAKPTIAITSTPKPSVVGQDITLRAKVKSPNSTVPSGTVVIRDGTTELGTFPLDAAGQVELALTPTLGKHTFKVIYSGDDHFVPLSKSAGHTVSKAPVHVSIIGPATAPVTGEPFDVRAVVTASPPGAGAPSGTVTFRLAGAELATVPLAGDEATVSVPGSSAGSVTIQAEYSGDASFLAGSAAASIEVAPAETSVQVQAAPPTVPLGEAVTLASDVTVLAPGAGQPIGTVTFLAGDDPIGAAALDGAGHAELVVDALSVGVHGVTAVYEGDVAFAASASGPVAVEVLRPKEATQVDVITSANPLTYGEAVHVTATVTGPSGPPTGDVELFVGETLLGTLPLDAAGTVTVTGPSPDAGSYLLTFNYLGDADHLASSGSLVQEIVPAASATTVVSTTNPATFGFGVQLTAAVAPVASLGIVAPGSVEFSAAGATLGTAALDSTGTASLTTASLPAGLTQVVATYQGSTNLAPSSGSVDQQVDIAQVACDAPGGRCNILFIETDDQSLDTMLDPETLQPRASYMPYLTNLVATEPGWYTFTQARAQDPLCGPSRWTLLTGLTSMRHGMTCNDIVDACSRSGEHSYQAARDRTMLEVIARAGYANSYIGKFENWYPCTWEVLNRIYEVPAGVVDWHVPFKNHMLFEGGYSLIESDTGSAARKVAYPFQFGDADYGTYVIRDKGLAWLDRCAAIQPCFSTWNPTSPHSPGAAPQDYDPSQVTPVPDHYPSYNEGCANAVDPDISDKPSFAQAHVQCPTGNAWNRNTYQPSLQATDRSIQSLFQRLHELDMYDNTIIVFTSDHGFSMNENNHITKEVPYETATRIPLFIRVPGLAGGRVGHLTYMPDLTATLYDIAEGTPIIPPDGLSLLPLLTGEVTTLHPDGVFLSHTEVQDDAMLDDVRPWWAWVHDCQVSNPCYKTVKYSTGEWEIYDLTNDPYEMRNKVANPVTGYPGDPGWDDTNPLVQALKANLEAHIALGV